MDGQTYRWKNEWMNIWVDGQMVRLTHWWTERQKDGQINIWAGQKDRKID